MLILKHAPLGDPPIRSQQGSTREVMTRRLGLANLRVAIEKLEPELGDCVAALPVSSTAVTIAVAWSGSNVVPSHNLLGFATQGNTAFRKARLGRVDIDSSD